MARRKRCTAWRSVSYKPHHGQGHVPFGTDGGQACRKCWVPCKNRAADDGVYCEECLSRLSTDPRSIVRRSLASDPLTPDSIIAFMTTDGDEGVSIVANAEYERRGIVKESPTYTPSTTEIVDPWG